MDKTTTMIYVNLNDVISNELVAKCESLQQKIDGVAGVDASN